MLSFRVLPACAVAFCCPFRGSSGDSSHGVAVPYSVVSARSPQSRACLTRLVPIPGFLNLLSVSSSAHLAGLFHPADTPGILTLQSFLLATSRAPSPVAPTALWTLPSCRIDLLGISIRRRRRLRPRFLRRWTCRLSSGLSSRLRARCLPPGVTRCGSPMLSWASLLSRVSPARRWLGFRRASSRALAGGTSQVALGRPLRPRFRVSLHRVGGCSLSRAPTLLRFFASCVHTDSGETGPGSWFPLGCAPVSPPARSPPWTFPSPCQSPV
jgi:hypothetical protein